MRPYEYALYRRWLCSGECNIRVDLRLLYPLFLIMSLHAGSDPMLETRTPPYVPPVPPEMPEVRVQAPLVYVQPVWEYKHLLAETAPSQGDLNALGSQGWELVAVLPAPNGVHCYFKRLVR